MYDSGKSSYEQIINEPRPPLTLRISVAGHRKIKNELLPEIRKQLQRIYTDIHKSVSAIAEDKIAGNIYSPSPPVIRITSSLAEGADRFCLEHDLIPFAFSLAAILPFSLAEYQKDFESEASVIDTEQGTVEEFQTHLQNLGYVDGADNSNIPLIELDGDPQNRTEAYNDCATVLVEHSDILIAVFDGDFAENAGTAATVASATKRGVPVIHLSTVNPLHVTIFPSCLFGYGNSVEEYTQENLKRELKRVLLYTDIINDDSSILERFRQYCCDERLKYHEDEHVDFEASGPVDVEKQYPSIGAKAFPVFKKILTRRKKKEQSITTRNSLCNDTQYILSEAQASKGEPGKTNDIHTTVPSSPSIHRLYSAFLRSDRLATYYSNIHRSTVFLIYLLGALALITAATALVLDNNHHVVFLVVLLELIILTKIFTLYRKDHQKNFHGRWLEYRFIAECFRPLLYLNLLGRNLALFTEKSTATALNREFVGHHDSARRWVIIYVASVVRWAGFSYCPLHADRNNEIMHFITEKWLKGQIGYHSYNVTAMQTMSKHFTLFSFTLFWATATAVFVKLALLAAEITLGLHFSYGVTASIALLTAIFPVLATTAFAIRNHAEFDISAQRSLSMRAILQVYLSKLAANIQQQQSAWYHRVLQRIAIETIQETAEWLEIYEVKESEPS